METTPKQTASGSPRNRIQQQEGSANQEGFKVPVLGIAFVALCYYMSPNITLIYTVGYVSYFGIKKLL